MFCSKCGCILDEKDNFCIRCGTPCKNNIINQSNNPNKKINNNSSVGKSSKKSTNKGIFIFIAGLIGCVLLLTFIVLCSRDNVSNPGKEETTMDVSMFDAVLYSDDKCVIGWKEYETYNSYYVEVGIIDNAGNWIVPLSKDFIFSEAFMEIDSVYDDVRPSSNNIIYLGDGVYIMSYGVNILSTDGSISRLGFAYPGENICYLYNINTGCSASFAAVKLSYCSDGNMLMYNSTRYNSNFYKVDMNGNVTEIPVEYDSWYDGPSCSGYSDGVFFANGYFYDIEGNVVCSVLEYELISTPYFSNGSCEITFKNPKGTVYTKVIDKNGNFIE